MIKSKGKMHLVIQVTEVWEIDPPAFSHHQTHWPESRPLPCSGCLPSSSPVPPRHRQMAANSAVLAAGPFSNHFLSATIKSKVSFWWHQLGLCAHVDPVIVVTGLECCGGLEETWMGNWTAQPESLGDISVTKQEGTDDEQRKPCFDPIILHLTGDETWAPRGYVSWQYQSSDIESSMSCVLFLAHSVTSVKYQVCK